MNNESSQMCGSSTETGKEPLSGAGTTSLTECLNTLSAFQVAVQSQVGMSSRPEIIYNQTVATLMQIAEFESLGIVFFDENMFDFVLGITRPESKRDMLGAALDNAVQSGVFAWALQQNQAVTVPSTDNGPTMFLGVIATRLRTYGMVIGLFSGTTLPDTSLKMASIILLSAAMNVENIVLNRRVSSHAGELETTVAKRTEALSSAKKSWRSLW